MSKSYQDEMFDFFTSEEAFSNLCKIAKHLPNIKSKLLETFWAEVKSKLTQLISNDEGWAVVQVEPLSRDISKLAIYKISWGTIEGGCPQLSVGYENLAGNTFYGPFIHNRVHNLNSARANQYLRSLNISNGYQKHHSTWYPFWEYTGIDLNIDASFSEILPDRRAETARLFANQLYELGKKLESDLEYCHQHFREHPQAATSSSSQI